MSLLNTDINIRNENQKSTQVDENQSMKIKMDENENTASGDAIHDSKSPITKKIKINESGDNNTLYITCTEFDSNDTFIEQSIDRTFADHTLENPFTETTSDNVLEQPILENSFAFEKTITESNLENTIVETTLDGTIEKLTINDEKPLETLEKKIEQVEIIIATFNKNTNFFKEPLDETVNLFTNNSDCTAYFNLDIPQSFADISYKIEEQSNSNEIWNMFNEYRQKGYIMSDTSSTFLLEESKLDESWLYDRVIDTKDQEDLEEIEILMKNFKFPSCNTIGLKDEKERSMEHMEKIRENIGDEFGPDVDTTNLLLLARQSLETYAEVEELYAKREKRARSIVRRRFHVTLEEFFDTIDEGIEKKEGLDRYEMFLEEVEKSTIQRERHDKIKKNLIKFNTFQILKNLKRPFKSQREKYTYFLTTKLAALYLNAKKVNKVISQRRGYASV